MVGFAAAAAAASFLHLNLVLWQGAWRGGQILVISKVIQTAENSLEGWFLWFGAQKLGGHLWDRF